MVRNGRARRCVLFLVFAFGFRTQRQVLRIAFATVNVLFLSSFAGVARTDRYRTHLAVYTLRHFLCKVFFFFLKHPIRFLTGNDFSSKISRENQLKVENTVVVEISKKKSKYFFLISI